MKTKKIIVLLLASLMVLSLLGCKKDKKDEIIQVGIVKAEEVLSFRQITVHYILPNNLDTMDELSEIAYDLVRQSYESHFETIGTHRYVINLHFYKSAADFTSKTTSYGYLIFDINLSLEQPGLTLQSNQLKLN